MKITEFLILTTEGNIRYVPVINSFKYAGRTVVIHETGETTGQNYTASDYITSLLIGVSKSKTGVVKVAKKILDEAIKRNYDFESRIKVNSKEFIYGYNMMFDIKNKDIIAGIKTGLKEIENR